jgi:hypothetical protein
MIIKTLYICEICYTEHEQKEDAEKCEAQVIVKENWQKIGEEKGFYGFGENGIRGPIMLRPYITPGSQHKTVYDGLTLSHNQGETPLTLNSLHPYFGYDFLRYVDRSGLSEELRKWKIACDYYGINSTVENPFELRWFDTFMWKFYRPDFTKSDAMKNEAVEFFRKSIS